MLLQAAFYWKLLPFLIGFLFSAGFAMRVGLAKLSPSAGSRISVTGLCWSRLSTCSGSKRTAALRSCWSPLVCEISISSECQKGRCYHGSGLSSRKKPPVGPLSGRVAAQPIPAARSLTEQATQPPPIAVSFKKVHQLSEIFLLLNHNRVRDEAV